MQRATARRLGRVRCYLCRREADASMPLTGRALVAAMCAGSATWRCGGRGAIKTIHARPDDAHAPAGLRFAQEGRLQQRRLKETTMLKLYYAPGTCALASHIAATSARPVSRMDASACPCGSGSIVRDRVFAPRPAGFLQAKKPWPAPVWDTSPPQREQRCSVASDVTESGSGA